MFISLTVKGFNQSESEKCLFHLNGLDKIKATSGGSTITSSTGITTVIESPEEIESMLVNAGVTIIK